jgi:AcrR family transcriptional regulator
VTDTRAVILDAAVAEMTRVGLRKLSLVEVARVAGVSRQTVYRYFRDRDELIAAVVSRDVDATLAATRAAVDGVADLRQALCAGIATVLRSSRQHPVLDALLATEPDLVVSFLSSPRSPVLRVARPVLEELVATRLPTVPVGRMRIFADVVARILVSYSVMPPDQPVDQIAATLADVFIDGVAA